MGKKVWKRKLLIEKKKRSRWLGVSALLNGTEILKKGECELLPTLKTVVFEELKTSMKERRLKRY